MADFDWGGTTGDWNTATLWAQDAVPNSFTADATLGVPGSYTVTISNETFSADSVTLDNASATLDLNYYAAGLTLGGAVDTLLLQAGTLDLALGTLAGGTLDQAGGSVVFGFAELYDMTVIGGITLAYDQELQIAGGFTLVSAVAGQQATIDLAANSDQFRVLDNETLANNSLLIGTTAANAGFDLYLADTLTIDAASTLDYAGISNFLIVYDQDEVIGGNYVAQGAFLNQGLFELTGTNDIFQAEIGGFINTGLLSVGSLETFNLQLGYNYGAAQGSFANSGTISIAAGGTFETNATLSAASLGTVINKGLLELQGLYDNTGQVLTIGTTGAFSNVFLTGILRGGTVVPDGGTLTFGNGSTLDGVTWGASNFVVPNGQILHIADGLTFSSPSETLDIGGQLIFQSGETLTGDTIVLTGSAAVLGTSGTGALTLGAGTNLLAEGAVSLNGSVVNYGTVDAAYGQIGFNLSGSVGQGTIEIGTGATLQATGAFSQTAFGDLINKGTLDIAGTLLNAGSLLDLATGTNFATLQLGGTIAGGTIRVDGGSLELLSGAVLSGVTYDGPLQVTGTSVSLGLENGAAFTGQAGSGPGSLALTGLGDTLNVLDNESLTNLGVLLGSARTVQNGNYGDTLNIGSTLTLGAGGLIEAVGPQVVNTIGNVAGFIDGGGTLINQGTLAAFGTQTNLLVDSVLFNTGTLLIGAGATLGVRVAGTLAPVLGTVVNEGGVLQLAGRISNTGSIIDIAAGSALSDVTFENLALTGGIVRLDGGTAAFTDSSSVFGVTFEGPLILSAPDSSIYTNGITLLGSGGVGPGTLELTGPGGYLAFYNGTSGITNQTLDNATIVIGNSLGTTDHISVQYSDTLTLGPNLLVDNIGVGDTAFIGGQGTVLNEGTIIAASTGGVLDLVPTLPGTFINLGTIEIDSGATLEVAFPATLASLGTILSLGGELLLSGSYNNTGTLALTGALQNSELQGTIHGGTIDETGGSLSFTRATLDGVGVIGPLDLVNPGATLTILDGTSLVGGNTIFITGAMDTLAVADSETLSHVLIEIGASPIGTLAAAADVLLADTTLTLGTDVTVDSTAPGALAELLTNYNGTLINDGTIIAGASAGLLAIEPLNYFDPLLDSFINNGTLVIGAGGTLEIADDINFAALGSIVNEGGLLELTGTYTNIGSIDVAATGPFSDVLLYGTLVGGTVHTDGGTLTFGNGVLSGATLVSDTIALGALQQLTLENGSTLVAPSGRSTITLTGGSAVFGLDNAETLNNAAIIVGGTYAYDSLGIESGTATLGSSTTIDVVGSGDLLMVESLGYSAAGLLNQGLIEVGSGGLFGIGVSGFVNTGAISLATGGQLSIEYSVAANLVQLGSIEGAGGELLAAGTLALAGETLTVGSTGPFSELYVSGQVLGGTIMVQPGGTIDLANGSTLNGVTVEGLLQEPTQSSYFSIANGLTLLGAGGVGPGTLAITGAGSEVQVLGNETLDNSVIVLSGSAGAFGGVQGYLQFAGLVSTGTLVLGPHEVVMGAEGGLGGPGTILNEGTIEVSANEGFYVTPYANYAGAPLFTNQGTVLIASGGTLVLATDINTASIGSVIESGGTLALADELVNTGTGITVSATGSLQNLVFGEVAEGFTYDQGIFVTGGSVVNAGGNVGFLGFDDFSGVTYDGTMRIGSDGFVELFGTSVVQNVDSTPDIIDLEGGGLYASAASTIVNAAITLDGTGALLQLDDAFSGSTILFGNPGGELDLFAPGSFAATSIEDFGAGSTIGVFSTAALSTLTYDGTNLIALAGSFAVATLDIGANYIGADFTYTTDTFNDYFITTTQNAPCYAAGTRIATDAGETAVQSLEIGDVVRLASGETSVVRWIGQRLVACDSHPRPELVWPIRIARDAFARGQPARDLVVSPDHALFVSGVLIPARQLLNGASIRQEKIASVHYFHVELERHDILLAEGLPAESYLDTGNRRQFANAGAVISLHPDYAAVAGWDGACAELVLAGPKVELARRRLLGRLPGLGYGLAAEGCVSIRVGGRVLSASRIDGDVARFVLPAGTRRCRILSNSGVPAALDARNADTRRLGACLTGLVHAGRLIPLDSARLGDGFWPAEAGWRWTDGAGDITLPDVAGEAVLEVTVREILPGWESKAGGFAPSTPTRPEVWTSILK